MLGSLLSGSFLGIFGAVGTGVLDFLKEKQRNKHELDMLIAQRDLVKAQGENAVSLENAKNFSASHESDKAAYSNPAAASGFLGVVFNALMILVDFLRGFTRPGLTWYFVILSTVACVYAIETVGITEELLTKIVESCVAACIELMSLCVTWWFGARSIKQMGRK